jgi:hypothetical protein
VRSGILILDLAPGFHMGFLLSGWFGFFLLLLSFSAAGHGEDGQRLSLAAAA